jgi:hypothetical protein
MPRHFSVFDPDAANSSAISKCPVADLQKPTPFQTFRTKNSHRRDPVLVVAEIRHATRRPSLFSKIPSVTLARVA